MNGEYLHGPSDMISEDIEKRIAWLDFVEHVEVQLGFISSLWKKNPGKVLAVIV